MSQPQRPMTIANLKTLAGAAAWGALADATAATSGTGLLARGPLRVGAVIVLGTLAALGCVFWLLKRLARRQDPNQLDPASELTTLTFPPTSRRERPRLHRAK